jgi:hypothetical protein
MADREGPDWRNPVPVTQSLSKSDESLVGCFKIWRGAKVVRLAGFPYL